jgi:leader peptidase (prepilin peptidase)/N-methyltransferase
MPQAAAIVLAFVGGAAIGSFLNVVVHRVPLGESVVAPRSRCPGCHTEIAGYDNIPVLSWILLRGRCRHCGTRISIRYPAIELLTAVTFAAVVAVRGADADLLLELPFVASLIALAFIDLDHQLLPNKIVYPMAVFGVIAAAIVDWGDFPERLLWGAGAFVVFLVIALVSAGMGMGDVKLAGTMGVYLGSALAPALLAAFLSGTIVGLAIIAREGAAARKKKVPFGVFLALGGLVGVLVGPDLVDLYRDRFLS